MSWWGDGTSYNRISIFLFSCNRWSSVYHCFHARQLLWIVGRLLEVVQHKDDKLISLQKKESSALGQLRHFRSC